MILWRRQLQPVLAATFAGLLQTSFCGRYMPRRYQHQPALASNCSDCRWPVCEAGKLKRDGQEPNLRLPDGDGSGDLHTASGGPLN
jgi:hypothetical protein